MRCPRPSTVSTGAVVTLGVDASAPRGVAGRALLLVTVTGCGGRTAIVRCRAEPVPAPPTLAISSQGRVTSDPVASLTVLVTSPDGVVAAVSTLRWRCCSSNPGSGSRWLLAGRRTVPARPPAGSPPAWSTQHPTTSSTQLCTRWTRRRISWSSASCPAGHWGPTPAATPAVVLARSAARSGIPVLAISAGGDGGDLASAGVILRSLLDGRLDELLAPGIRVLNVPSCDQGMVRGLVEVDVADDANVVAVPDCGGPDPVPPDTDVAAYDAGFATIVELTT